MKKPFSPARTAMFLLCVLIPAVSSTVWGQTSANFKLEEYTFNNGGDPKDGIVLQSTAYSITLDAMGDAIAGQNMSGSSYQTDAGFVTWYPPPGEVINLMFTDSTSMTWNFEPSIGLYNVYSGDVTDLSTGYGSCYQTDLTVETVTVADLPPAGTCYFYLVTADNRLNEEGTMGFNSVGTKRTNSSPCP